MYKILYIPTGRYVTYVPSGNPFYCNTEAQANDFIKAFRKNGVKPTPDTERIEYPEEELFLVVDMENKNG